MSKKENIFENWGYPNTVWFGNGRIKDLEYNPEVLSIFSREVLKRIKACEEGTWESSVPDGVADIIKEKHLFDSSSCKLH